MAEGEQNEISRENGAKVMYLCKTHGKPRSMTFVFDLMHFDQILISLIYVVELCLHVPDVEGMNLCFQFGMIQTHVSETDQEKSLNYRGDL